MTCNFGLNYSRVLKEGRILLSTVSDVVARLQIEVLPTLALTNESLSVPEPGVLEFALKCFGYSSRLRD
jgi:hypothetical protein